jgi:hypothetical protein
MVPKRNTGFVKTAHKPAADYDFSRQITTMSATCECRNQPFDIGVDEKLLHPNR